MADIHQQPLDLAAGLNAMEGAVGDFHPTHGAGHGGAGTPAGFNPLDFFNRRGGKRGGKKNGKKGKGGEEEGKKKSGDEGKKKGQGEDGKGRSGESARNAEGGKPKVKLNEVAEGKVGGEAGATTRTASTASREAGAVSKAAQEAGTVTRAAGEAGAVSRLTAGSAALKVGGAVLKKAGPIGMVISAGVDIGDHVQEGATGRQQAITASGSTGPSEAGQRAGAAGLDTYDQTWNKVAGSWNDAKQGWKEAKGFWGTAGTIGMDAVRGLDTLWNCTGGALIGYGMNLQSGYLDKDPTWQKMQASRGNVSGTQDFVAKLGYRVGDALGQTAGLFSMPLGMAGSWAMDKMGYGDTEVSKRLHASADGRYLDSMLGERGAQSFRDGYVNLMYGDESSGMSQEAMAKSIGGKTDKEMQELTSDLEVAKPSQVAQMPSLQQIEQQGLIPPVASQQNGLGSIGIGSATTMPQTQGSLLGNSARVASMTLPQSHQGLVLPGQAGQVDYGATHGAYDAHLRGQQTQAIDSRART